MWQGTTIGWIFGQDSVVDAATALPDHWSVLKYDKLFLFSVPQQQRGCLGWVVWLFVAATAHEDEILINAHCWRGCCYDVASALVDSELHLKAGRLASEMQMQMDASWPGEREKGGGRSRAPHSFVFFRRNSSRNSSSNIAHALATCNIYVSRA